jgi:hypothetical protein
MAPAPSAAARRSITTSTACSTSARSSATRAARTAAKSLTKPVTSGCAGPPMAWRAVSLQKRALADDDGLHAPRDGLRAGRHRARRGLSDDLGRACRDRSRIHRAMAGTVLTCRTLDDGSSHQAGLAVPAWISRRQCPSTRSAPQRHPEESSCGAAPAQTASGGSPPPSAAPPSGTCMLMSCRRGRRVAHAGALTR